MRYTHIVFDVDGTLIDTFYSNMRSLQDTLKARTGQDCSLDDLAWAFGLPGVETLEQLGVPEAADALRQWEETLQRYRHTDKVFAGIPQLLEKLAAAGCSLGIVTSRTRAEFDADFVHLDIARYFTTAITADDTALHKPHPDPLLKYLERTGAQPEEVLYIGDSRHDMSCAAAAGVDSGLAGWGAKGERSCTHPFAAPRDVEKLVLG